MRRPARRHPTAIPIDDTHHRGQLVWGDLGFTARLDRIGEVEASA